jgi:hypothetical protein
VGLAGIEPVMIQVCHPDGTVMSRIKGKLPTASIIPIVLPRTQSTSAGFGVGDKPH